MGLLWKFEASSFRVAESLRTQAYRARHMHPATATLDGGPWQLIRTTREDMVLYFMTASEGHRVCIHGSAAELRAMCLDMLAALMEED